MNLRTIAAPLIALVASATACASPVEHGSAPIGLVSAPSASGVAVKPSSSAVEVAPELAPSPFRLVGDLALDLHVLSDGRVIGERLREATDAEAVRESLGVGGFVRDSFLLLGHRFDHINRVFGVSAGVPAVHRLIVNPDGAIDTFLELFDGQILREGRQVGGISKTRPPRTESMVRVLEEGEQPSISAAAPASRSGTRRSASSTCG